MKSIERGKREIERFIKIQIIVNVAIITAGCIIYGVNTEKWSTALLVAITLLAFASILVLLTYTVAMNRLEKISGNMFLQ